MTDDRLLVARAVFAGQLPAVALTDAEILELDLEVMDMIIEKKALNNPMVFSGVDGLLN